MVSMLRRSVAFLAVVVVCAVSSWLPSAAQDSAVTRQATPAAVGTARSARTSRWVSAKVNRTKLNVNDVLIITFTVNNYQAEGIKSYPYRPTDSDITFTQDECWAKRKTNSVSLLYPKQTNNYRVMAGYTGWDASHPTLNAQCSTVTSGKNTTIDHPWRWGIGEATLLSNGQRIVTGRVRFTKKGIYTVFFGLVRDYVGYPNQPVCDSTMPPLNNACFLDAVTITVGDVSPSATATRRISRTPSQTAVPTDTETPTPTGPTETAGPPTDTRTPSNTRTQTNTRTKTATRAARTATRTSAPAKTATPRMTATTTDGESYPIPTPFFSPTRTRVVVQTATRTKTATIETDTTPTEEVIW